MSMVSGCQYAIFYMYWKEVIKMKKKIYMACLSDKNYDIEFYDENDLMLMLDNLINCLQNHWVDDNEILDAINDDLDLNIKESDC